MSKLARNKSHLNCILDKVKAVSSLYIGFITDVHPSHSASMPKKPSARGVCKHGPENTFNLLSPLGTLELVCCPKGVHKLHLLDVDCDAKFKPVPDQEVSIHSQLYQDNGYTYKSALMCVQWLQIYFQDFAALEETPKPPICHLLGIKSETDGAKPAPQTAFTDKVWFTLFSAVPPGSVLSYGELATRSGSTPRASRAVGQAMRSNPVMILVPCHRVILSSGAMGNYSRGTKNAVKAWLLRHERGKHTLT